MRIPPRWKSFVSVALFLCAPAALWAQTPDGPAGVASRLGYAGAAMGSDARCLYLRAGTIDTRGRPSLLMPGTTIDPTGYYVVQLDGPMTPSRREALAAGGIKLGEYLPMNAYVVRLDDERVAALSRLDFIAWIGEYEDAWKLAPNIGRQQFKTPERQQLAADGKHLLVVSLFGDADSAAAAASLSPLGAVARRIDAGPGKTSCEIEIHAAAVENLRGLKQVMFVEEAAEGEPRNATTTWLTQSGMADSTPLWDAGLHGEGQLAGIIDWAMREGHCSFYDPDGEPIGPTHRKIEAYYGLGVPSAYAFHGTHVAGVCIGDDPQQTDVNLRGLAYAARVVFQHYDTVITATSLFDRLTVAHGHGVCVHSNSWGNTQRDYIAWSRDIDLFTHTNEDDLVLVAVTNSNVLVQAPENAKNCLAVAATQDTPSEGQRCFGGYGPTTDGRQKPEVWGVGCGSIAAGATPCGTHSGGGTSYAAPAVAAVGLLARQYFQEGYYPTGAPVPEHSFTPSGALLKAVLINSAVDMTGFAGYYSFNEGWGRVLMDEALYFDRPEGDPRRLILRDVRHASGLSTGETSIIFTAVRSADQPLKITLVWSDAPAVLSATYTPVNDLDLVVTDPQGAVYRGNVFSGMESATGGAADPLNNNEQVHRLSPVPGKWRIDVFGAAVNQGPQGYALVITGDALDGDPCGDLDGDYIVDGSDYAVFLAAFGAPADDPRYNPQADFDDDGVVSLLDYQTWLGCYRLYVDDDKALPPSPGLLGDMNADGVVNGLDIQGFVMTLLDPYSASPRDRTIADLNGDRQWDTADVVLLAAALTE